MMMRYAMVAGFLCIIGVSATPSQASWNEALRQLRSERSSVEQCLRASRQLDAAAQKTADLKYEKTRQLLKAVYSDLQSLLSGKRAVELSTLEHNFSSAVAERQSLCKMVPNKMKSGTRNVMLNVVKSTIKPGLEAIKTLFGFRNADQFKQRTLATGLEAAKLQNASKVIKPE